MLNKSQHVNTKAEVRAFSSRHHGERTTCHTDESSVACRSCSHVHEQPQESWAKNQSIHINPLTSTLLHEQHQFISSPGCIMAPSVSEYQWSVLRSCCHTGLRARSRDWRRTLFSGQPKVLRAVNLDSVLGWTWTSTGNHGSLGLCDNRVNAKQ